MKCNECTELLTSLTFDEVSQDQELAIFEHISDCESCREAYMEALETKAKLEESLQSSPAIEGLTSQHKDKIMASLNEQTDPQPVKTFPSWIFALAACIAVGVIVGVNLSSDPSYNMAKSEEAPRQTELQTAEKESLEEAKSAGAPEPIEKAARFKAKEDKGASFADSDVKLESDALIENSVAAVKEEAKKKTEGRSRKMKPAAEIQALQADAVSPQQTLASITVSDFRKMLTDYSKKTDLSKLEKELISKIGMLKNNQIQLVKTAPETGSDNGAEKILLRILNNAEKAIDYAHIFVHNQNIIQVERVR